MSLGQAETPRAGAGADGRAMRIGYMIPEFPGQTHSFFQREIAALERLGVEVVLVSTRLPPERLIVHDWARDAIGRTFYLAPLEPTELPGLLASPRLWTTRAMRDARRTSGSAAALEALKFAPFAAKLARFCAARRIGHVHVGSCGRTALIAAIARRMGGPSYSLTLHNPLTTFGPHQEFKWSAAAFATVITRTILSEVRRTLGGHAPASIRVQSMGVNTDRFARAAPYEPWRPGEPLRLFSCARLNPAKGHLVAVEAVATLRARGIDARLEIAGEDDAGGSGFRRDVERAIVGRGLGGEIRLLGAVDESAVIRGLNAAHVFVLASDAEPLGVAYMEAMSCELPTVGTAAGGVPELITQGEDGLLVPPQAPDALADAIESLARDPERATAMGRAGRRTVTERFEASLGARTLREMMAADAPAAFSA